MFRKRQKQQEKVKNIEPGMLVEATRGDLGKEDVSKPTVADVVRDPEGNVEKIVVQKGVIFRKELEVPAERIEGVMLAAENEVNGTVRVDAREDEIESLAATGIESLALKSEREPEPRDLLDEIEEAIPTVEGVREMEQANVEEAAIPSEQKQRPVKVTPARLLRMLGPGLLAGVAGNDSSAVTAYVIDGAQSGFSHLWLLLLSTPMYQAVQYACAKLGRVTQKGLAEVLREHYGRWVAMLAALTLIIANVALIAADLVAIGSGLSLMMHIDWIWFIVPVAAILWYLTVYQNFDSLKKIFLVMSLAFVVYIVIGFLARPNWGEVLFNTVVPHIDFDFASISSAVALLGATISPYTIFWQVQGEKEERRPGTLQQKFGFAAIDIGVGVVSGNLVAFFIIVSTAARLAGKPISTAADAAGALSHVLGPIGLYLFAIGLIGAGFVAIPVLLASTSYAVAGTFGWPVGLSKKPWQSEGFYLILTASLLVSLAMAFLRLNPIQLIFWANIISGVLAPVLVIYLIVVGNNGKIMCGQKLGPLTNAFLILTALVMIAGSVLLFYGLATGQG